MGFFDTLGKTLSEVGQTTLKKGAEVASTAKYSLMISDEERKIEKIYQEMGKKYYELHKEDYGVEFSPMIADIEDCKAKIVEYKEKIKDVKGIIKCEACGSDIPVGVAYCPECGEAVKKAEEEEVPVEETSEEKTICYNCGEELNEGTKFCTKCGANQDAAPAEENKTEE